MIWSNHFVIPVWKYGNMADRTFAIRKHVKLRRLSLGPPIHTSRVVGKSSPNLDKESKQRQKQTKYDTWVPESRSPPILYAYVTERRWLFFVKLRYVILRKGMQTWLHGKRRLSKSLKITHSPASTKEKRTPRD